MPRVLLCLEIIADHNTRVFSTSDKSDGLLTDRVELCAATCTHGDIHRVWVEVYNRGLLPGKLH